MQVNDYEEHANDPGWWADKAREMSISAEILYLEHLKASELISTHKPATVPPAYVILPVIVYLYSIAIELYLKTVLVKNGAKFVKDDVFVGNASHTIPKLAEEANFNLSEEETMLAKKLEDCIKYWGRYPVPKDKSSWRKPVSDLGGTNPIWAWSEQETNTVQDLIDKLQHLTSDV